MTIRFLIGLRTPFSQRVTGVRTSRWRQVLGAETRVEDQASDRRVCAHDVAAIALSRDRGLPQPRVERVRVSAIVLPDDLGEQRIPLFDVREGRQACRIAAKSRLTCRVGRIAATEPSITGFRSIRSMSHHSTTVASDSPSTVGISSDTVGWIGTAQCSVGVGRARVHHVEDAVDRLVAAGAEDRGAEDRVASRHRRRTFMKPCVSPFSTARPTRVIGRVPDRAPVGRSARASASVMPTRPSGGSM